jgi:hypothetical protein
MYVYVGATCLGRSTGSQWSLVDLRQMEMRDIFNKFRSCFLELSNPVLPNNVYVDAWQFKDEPSYSQRTFTQFLIDVGNRTLATVPSLPSSRISYARYSDAIRAGYKINPTTIGNPEEDITVNSPDLKITKVFPETDLRLIHTHCLITVNGYYHQTDANVTGTAAYVLKGAESMRKCRMNQLGILSFLDIGRVSKVQITNNLINGLPSDNGLKNRAYLTLNQDTTNKTVLLSLGGYLIFQEANVFWQSGANVFTLNLQAMPYIERFYESNLYLDFSALGLTINAEDPSHLILSEFLSDAIIKKFLTLPQTFFIVIDTPSLITNKYFLHQANMPGMLTAYQEPVHPLIVNYGKVADYWRTKEDGFWSITVTDDYFRNFVLSFQNKLYTPNLTNKLIPGKRYFQSRGHFLEIGAYDQI